MNDCLVLTDLFDDFRHDDGDALFVSFCERFDGLRALIEWGRDADLPIIYANDNFGVWDGNASRTVEAARNGRGSAFVPLIAPQGEDRFVLKPRYSAFDHTPLELILRTLEVERLLLAGMATEMCVAQSAISARERGFKVTVVASACACVDEKLEQVALRYLEEVVGVHIASGVNDLLTERRQLLP